MAEFWACARTHPHQEKLALINLRRQKYTAFFPFFMVKNRKGNSIIQAAFPSYVFVQLDDLDINWAPINFTLGVQRLLTHPSDDDYRLPCKANFIGQLYQMRIMGMDHNPDVIPPGTVVRIKHGAFVNREALVEMSTEHRVRVLLQVFSREVSMDIEVAAVERVAQGASV